MFADIVDVRAGIGVAIAQGQHPPQKEGTGAEFDAPHKTTAPHLRFGQCGAVKSLWGLKTVVLRNASK